MCWELKNKSDVALWLITNHNKAHTIMPAMADGYCSSIFQDWYPAVALPELHWSYRKSKRVFKHNCAVMK